MTRLVLEVSAAAQEGEEEERPRLSSLGSAAAQADEVRMSTLFSILTCKAVMAAEGGSESLERLLPRAWGLAGADGAR